MLSQQQCRAIELALEGRNVFVTGSGGVGKSFLIERLIEELQAREKVVYVTASTGIAATNIGGTTVHAWAGIGTGTDPVEQLAAQIKFRNKRVKARWGCDVLVIDEISMLDPQFFDTLNQLGKRVRARNVAFGGIQLVLCGDFFQLPPVRPKTVQFPFQTKAWQEANIERIELTQVFRQADQHFVSVLERVRWANLDTDVLETLKGRLGAELDCSDGIQPTHLYATNDRVDAVNEARLEQLTTEPKVFRCRQTFSSKMTLDDRKRIGERVAKDCSAQPELTLKVGAQVMLLVNLDVKNGLSNGSRGVVIGFAEASPRDVSGFTAPIVRFTNGLELQIKYYGWRIKSPEGWSVLHEQIPLRLAWAWTIHKCVAGSTLIPCSKGLVRMDSLFAAEQQQGESVDTRLVVNGQSERRTATKLYKGFVEAGYRITTESGFQLEGSERHPIWASQTEVVDWYKLPDLRVGDLAAIRFGTLAQSSAPREQEVGQEQSAELAYYTLQQECKLSDEFVKWACPDPLCVPWVILQNNRHNQQTYLDTLFAQGPISVDPGLARQIQVLAANLGFLCTLGKQLEVPQLLGQGLIFDPIVSIEQIPEQQLYDFEIPEGHDFVGNGFVNHNSQGMTLDKVVLDLGKTFDFGQAYVALSRVRSLEGCSILSLNPSKIKASQVVCEYYKN